MRDPQSGWKKYSVWSLSVRVFHWLNVLCVLALIAVGLAIYFHKDLGVSADGKLLLKTIHVYIGYVFVFNFLWRVIGLFGRNQYSNWRGALPMGKNYRRSLVAYIKQAKAGDSPEYLGHNPVARLMIGLLFTLLAAQAVTGLVLAGTDVYMPPFGAAIEQWVAASDESGNQFENIKPGSKEQVDPQAYQDMRAFRKPFISVHKYAFYLLLVAIVLHILAVVLAEVKERSGLVSAMFSGDKVFAKKPVDIDEK